MNLPIQKLRSESWCCIIITSFSPLDWFSFLKGQPWQIWVLQSIDYFWYFDLGRNLDLTYSLHWSLDDSTHNILWAHEPAHVMVLFNFRHYICCSPAFKRLATSKITVCTSAKWGMVAFSTSFIHLVIFFRAPNNSFCMALSSTCKCMHLLFHHTISFPEKELPWT